MSSQTNYFTSSEVTNFLGNHSENGNPILKALKGINSLSKMTERVYDIGDVIEDFELESQFGSISYRDLVHGKYSIIVTFGNALEPCATTDIGMLGKLIQEFEARNISILAIGCDTVPNYRKWIKDIEELNSTKINFPLLADPEMKVLYKFGCARDIPPKKEYKLLCNGAFIIDLDFRIRFSYKYSTHVGRNLYELLRAYDALQLALTHRIVTPSNWGMGQDVLLHNDVTNEEANHLRFAVVKPYFRLAACPEGSE